MFTSSKTIHNIRTNGPPICRIIQSPRQRNGTRMQGPKYHTIATLCTINPACPVKLWDRFVPQIEATLNIMRTSRIDSTKSAYEALNGRKSNWNRTSLTPVSQRALAFLDPANRLTWAPHAIDAFTLGFTPDHYRSLRLCNKHTGG